MRTILVAVVGTTPQVISETVWSLACQSEPPILPDEIHVATTTRGRSSVKPLFADGGKLSELLKTIEGAPAPAAHIHVFGTDGEAELEDIRTASDSNAFAAGLTDLIRRLALDPDCRIIASIAGGRKTMSVILAQAMSLFARAQDRLTHVLVPPEFESARDFWFPTDEPVQVTNATGTVLDASKAVVELADMHFVRLRDCLSAQELRSLVTDPGSLVRQAQQELSSRRHAAHVSLEVEGVSTGIDSRHKDKRWLLVEVLRTLPAGAALTLRVEVSPQEPGRIRLYLDCVGHGSTPEAAGKQAERIAASIRQALDFRRFGYQLSYAPPPAADRRLDHAVTLRPTGHSLWSSEARLASVDADRTWRGIKLGGRYQGLISRNIPLGLLAGVNETVSFSWTATPFALASGAVELIDESLTRLYEPTITSTGEARYDERTVLPVAQADQFAAELKTWKRERRGIACSATLASSAPIPDSVIEELGIRVWGGRSFEARPAAHGPAEDGSLLDLASCFPLSEPAPFDVPPKTLLQEAGIPTSWSPAPMSFRSSGVVVAESQGRSIQLSDDDRARHLYVLGSTGTGKSTLLFNLIRQDIENGAGVFVLDPHGDLVSELLSVIPAGRSDDVVVLDASDPDCPFSINLLGKADDGDVSAAGFITNEMITMVKRLYANTPEAFGPMFEQYFRTALMAVLSSDAVPNPTLLDVSSFFTYPRFRGEVIAACSDAEVTLQYKMAAAAGGDASWDNITPYIISKINRFTLDPRMRRLTCRPHNNVDFTSLISNRTITLVQLPKGAVDEMNVRMLGMLVTSKLFGAALRGSAASGRDRTPTHVYIDEFQNFTTDSVAHILAEGRKFGIRLTLANQNLAQIDRRSREAVLGNAANLVVFRTGPADADSLVPYFDSALTRNDLQALPNFHAAMRILNNGAPVLPAFVARTLAGASPDYACADPAALVAASRARFVRESEQREHAAQAREESPRHDGQHAGPDERPADEPF